MESDKPKNKQSMYINQDRFAATRRRTAIWRGHHNQLRLTYGGEQRVERDKAASEHKWDKAASTG
jgi:hypothetical protein